MGEQQPPTPGERPGETSSVLPDDVWASYDEKVYAGVLGKLIGVYLGRPVEGWTYEQIQERLGSIDGYVADRVGVPLIVTDDDITGTFTFVRALEDSSLGRDVDPRAVGEAWLNYLIEQRTILWWGGLGNSTEHTAYRRLKEGIAPPRSGSAELNGTILSEQIGAQIFIDSWAMIAPGQPALAASLARRAASVSHDGEAVHAAALLAAMEAQAFLEDDIDRLLDVGLAAIPSASVIANLVRDLRVWRTETDDWRVARERLAATYGYERYPWNVHVVPNHGLIILALLWGDGDFDRSMLIVNNCGWDTDCNSGNLGALLGIRGGLAAFDGAIDWRGPIADRLYLPTADGSRSITDALVEADRLAAMGRRLGGQETVPPKGGARYHFSQRGALQGFDLLAGSEPPSPATNDVATDGARALRVDYAPRLGTVRATTPVFIPPADLTMPGYPLLATPAIHPGQTVDVRASWTGSAGAPATVRVSIGHYDAADRLAWRDGAATPVAAQPSTLRWTIPDVGGQPIARLGVALDAAIEGTLWIHSVSIHGQPDVALGRPAGGNVWRRAWVDATDGWNPWHPEPFRISSNRGDLAMLSHGGLGWTDYQVETELQVYLADEAGIALRVSGMCRWYGLVLVRPGRVQLLRGDRPGRPLAEATFDWHTFTPYRVTLEANGAEITGAIEGGPTLVARDTDAPLTSGGVAIVVRGGTAGAGTIRVRPRRP